MSNPMLQEAMENLESARQCLAFRVREGQDELVPVAERIVYAMEDRVLDLIELETVE